MQVTLLTSHTSNIKILIRIKSGPGITCSVENKNGNSHALIEVDDRQVKIAVVSYKITPKVPVDALPLESRAVLVLNIASIHFKWTFKLIETET